jgi:hypothetical protein
VQVLQVGIGARLLLGAGAVLTLLWVAWFLVSRISAGLSVFTAVSALWLRVLWFNYGRGFLERHFLGPLWQAFHVLILIYVVLNVLWSLLAGFVCPAGQGQVGILSCKDCDPGKFSTFSGQCADCPSGTYQLAHGAENCTSYVF